MVIMLTVCARPAAAQDWTVTQPAVAHSVALDHAVDQSDARERLIALRAQFAEQWREMRELEAQSDVEVIRDVGVTRQARRIDESFMAAVAQQELDADGLIAYAMSIAWCDKLAVIIRTTIPGERARDAEDFGWRVVAEATEDLQRVVSGANALAQEELATAMQLLDVLWPRTRNPDLVPLAKWRSQRLRRMMWLAQELAGDDTHQALMDASGNLSLLVPVTRWVRENTDDPELDALCSSLEGELADHWQRYWSVMATAQSQRSAAASRDVFRLWHSLVQRERDSINLVLAVCRDAGRELPHAVRLIETAVNHRNPYAD